MSKVEWMTFRVQADLKREIERAAEKEKRSASNLCRKVIQEWLEQRRQERPRNA